MKDLKKLQDIEIHKIIDPVCLPKTAEQTKCNSKDMKIVINTITQFLPKTSTVDESTSSLKIHRTINAVFGTNVTHSQVLTSFWLLDYVFYKGVHPEIYFNIDEKDFFDFAFGTTPIFGDLKDATGDDVYKN